MANVGKKTGKQTQAGRDVYETPEGKMVSEKSTTFEYKGKWVNIPTIHDGKEYSDAELIEMLDEGLIEPTSTHDKLEEALEAAESRSDSLEFDKGDTPMLEEQMELFNEGGLKDEGGEVDPESGNDVPIGSTKKEVRDDIPAMLSEGEFVFPADVVRYVGLENLMRIRQDAKMGLKKMEAMGQMGNSEEATIPDDMPFDMADLIIVTGEQEEDKPREMAEGGVVHANQGTFMPSTGIDGYQQSVFQNQPQVSVPFVPASSIAPPPPAPSPAGGYMPKFMTNNATPFDDGSLAPKTNTGTTGTTDDFVPTVDDVYTQKEYINPETGETRIINFYNNNPVNEIPKGFIPKEDYNPDETTTTDLESTSVTTTQVTDDGSADKKKLSDMVAAQQAKQAEDFKDKFNTAIKNPVENKTDLIDLYATFKNQQTLATGFAPFTGGTSLLAKPFISGNQDKLEEALVAAYGEDWKNNEAIQAIDNMTFMDKVKNAFSSLVENFTTDDDKPYEAIYNTKDHPLGGGYSSGKGDNDNYSGAFGMLSAAEQQAYDNAVNMGNVNVANHYAIINHHRHLELERGEVSDGTKVNLAGTETPSGSSSNNNDDDNSAIEKIAQENAQKIAAANLDQAKTNLEEAAAANPNENIYTGGGPMGGFKKGGLVNKKKK